MRSIWKPMLVLAAAASLGAVGCETNREERATERDAAEGQLLEQNRPEQKQQPPAGEEQRPELEREEQAGRTGAVDASGLGHVYEVRRVDPGQEAIFLEPVKTGVGEPADAPMTLSFSEFERALDKSTPLEDPRELQEGRQLGIYRDSENRISRIVVEKNVERQSGGTEPSEEKSTDEPGHRH